MPVGARHVALRNQIAVGQQHRRLAFVGFDARGVDRHHVRPVEEIGDAAETLGFALRAIGGAGAVKPHELGVARRIDDGLDFEFEGLVRRLRNGEPVRRRDERFAGSGLPSSASERSLSSSPSSTSGAGVPALLGFSFSLERTVVAVGSSETSRSTVSINQSGGR